MDGGYFMLGSSWPLDRDPRAVRRDMLRDATIRWDPEHEKRSRSSSVEFSDFQCPACKHSWVTVKEVLGKLGGTVRHGMVNYPLTNNHPWAFAAAVAGECVGRTWPDRFLPVKEEFYRLQDSMTVETVKDAARGFLAPAVPSGEAVRGLLHAGCAWWIWCCGRSSSPSAWGSSGRPPTSPTARSSPPSTRSG